MKKTDSLVKDVKTTPKEKDPEAEEVIEERIVSAIYQNFKPTIETRYGI